MATSPDPTPGPNPDTLFRFCWSNGGSCFELTNSTSITAVVILAAILLLAVLVWRFGKPLASRLQVAADAAKAAQAAAELAARRASEGEFAVTNGHELHIRDDLDEKVADLKANLHAGFAPILASLDAVKSDIRGLRAELGEMRTDIRGNRERIEKIGDRLTEHIEDPNREAA